MFSAFSCLLLVNSLKWYFVGIYLLLTLYKTCQIHVVNQIETGNTSFDLYFFLQANLHKMENCRGIEWRGFIEHNL